MIIRFLGTSAGWPLPRLGCDCKICYSKDSKDKRLRPALLVNENVLVDAGPDIYHELVNRNPERIEAVIITHDHWDHTFGLSDLGKLYGSKKKLVLISTEAVLKSLKRRQRYTPYLSSFEQKVAEPFKPINICGIKLGLFPVFHSKSAPTYGINLENKFFYLPDYKIIPPKSMLQIKNARILVLDGSGCSKMFNHASIDEGIALAKIVAAREVYFTHIGHKTGTHQELTRYVREKGGKNFHIAFDGLELQLLL